MKCKRLSAAILSLVMIISLLPTTALAAEENDVWSTAYDKIRIYLDEETKKDLKDLDGTIREVRIISSKYTEKDGDGNRMRLCWPLNGYWWTENLFSKVTANDIRRIDLARDKPIGSSPTISIPIEGDTTYEVKVSQEHHKGWTSVDSYDYLRIDITKREHHTVTYEFSGTAGVDYPSSVTPPEDKNTYTETSVVDLKQPAQTTVAGKKDGKDGTWTFKGWTLPDGVTFTDDTHAKFTMPDTKVTVTGTWTFEATPPTGTSVYVYFKTVNTKNELVQIENNVVKYNKNGDSWATLGELKTTANVATASAEDLGKKVIAGTGFTRHSSNSGLSLSLIKSWDALHLKSGAVDYEDAGDRWHLDGTVYGYRAIYYDSDGTELAGFTPKYYLEGTTGIEVTDVKPTAPAGKTFDCWVTNDVTVEGDTFIMPDHDVKFTPQWKPITADLIDDDITITHGVDATPADGDDTAAHIVNKDATISYQATLDMKSLRFGDNPKNTDAVSFIKNQIGNGSPWEFMEGKNITTFAGSKVNLYVKFSDKLVNPATLDGITLESGWFKLDPAKSPTYDGTTKYWTIPCVIKNADAEDAPDTSKSIITLSGVSLSLTEDAQDELSSDKDLDIISEGYIDGTIMISGQALKLEGKSQEKPAQNTAKLKLDVPTYTVTYRGNGADSGETTDTNAYTRGTVATVKANGFTRSKYTFTGWNTSANGSGRPYAKGDQITMTDNVVLYAQWTRNSSRDDDDKYFFAIQKVDAQDGHALNDAKFELYQRDSRDNKLPASRKTTAHWGPESGIALFSVSATKTSDGGSTWYYREITAPEGYALDTKEYEISAGDFYHDDQSKAVAKAKTVRNYRGTTPDLLNDSDHFAYVIGYMDGNVRPYGLISRAETTTIFFRLLKDSVRDGNLLTSNTYTDVADDYWANTAISTMTGLGIVQGRSTTTFDPKAPITRAQFAAICARFDTGKSNGEQTFSDIQGHWAEKYIERAAELGWIKGFEDGTFRPDTYITRAQAMTMINRVLNRIPEDESDLLPGMNVWPDCNPGDWFYLAVQEATNSHDFEHKAGNYETWTKLMKNPDWTRYEN